MKNISLLNEDTGEITSLNGMNLSKNSINKITKKVVNDMLANAKDIEGVDKTMLFTYLKANKEINDYNQIKLKGSYRDEAFEKKMIEDITLYGYVSRVILLAHNFSGILKKSQRTFITSWTELWEEIGCAGNKRTIKRVKDFLVNEDIIREEIVVTKDGKIRKFILNPFLFRKASYSSQLAIRIFEDYIDVNGNISSEACTWLECLGLIGHHESKLEIKEDKKSK